MSLYAQCQICGHEFEVNNILATGDTSVRVKMYGNTINCPKCGHDARLVEGDLQVTTGKPPEIISGPEWSRELIERMAQQLNQIEDVARSPKLSDAEAQAKVENLLHEIEATNPIVAEQFRKLADLKDRRTWGSAAKSVGVTILAGVGAIESVSALSERIYQTWVSLTGG